MAPLAVVAGTAFGTAAYYAPTDFLQKSMVASSVLAFAIIPWTLLVIFPTNKQLKNIESSGDALKANTEGDKLLAQWINLSNIRYWIMTVSFLNGLYQLSEWHAL
jgi:hypothetical protein